MRTVGNPRIPEILVEVEGDFLRVFLLILLGSLFSKLFFFCLVQIKIGLIKFHGL